MFNRIRKLLGITKSYASHAYDEAEQRPAVRFDDDDPHPTLCMCVKHNNERQRAYVKRVSDSPWVQRAEDNDLPTFDRHNGADAYRR